MFASSRFNVSSSNDWNINWSYVGMAVLIVVFIILIIYVIVPYFKRSGFVDDGFGTIGAANIAFDKRTEELEKKILSDLSGSNMSGGLVSENYNQFISEQALDPEVFTGHTEYMEENTAVYNGASMLSERDDVCDPVPYVGLFRPDKYNAYAAPDARQVPSEYVDDMAPPTKLYR